MRDILQTCVRIERAAARLYADMGDRCDDTQASECLAGLARDEEAHASWWRDLSRAHESGLLPDLWEDTEAVRERLHETLVAIRSSVPAEGRLSGRDALAAAAAIELFLADQAFAELIEFGGARFADERQDEYDKHVRRLVSAIERSGASGLERLLGVQLRRTWNESVGLAREGVRDALTGLGNRRALAVHAERWASWCARYGRPLAVLVLDLDRFRAVNERHGRAAGDATLLAVAESLRATVRASDVPARYGSDEFAVLAPETGPEEARALAERVAKTVHEAMVASDAGIVRPSVSVGIAAVLDPPGSEPRAFEELMTAADRALYAAKRSGRDRIADPVVLAAAVPSE